MATVRLALGPSSESLQGKNPRDKRVRKFRAKLGRIRP
jgi:hypothetical protein